MARNGSGPAARIGGASLSDALLDTLVAPPRRYDSLRELAKGGTMAPNDLEDKVMFVTGAGRGIGRGIAEVAAEMGMQVAVNALTATYVEPLAARIAAECGQRVLPVVGDVTTSKGATAAIEHVLAEMGRIDVLVNNLGDAIAKPLVSLPGGAEGMTDEEVQRVLDLNLTATICCTRAVGPHLLERRAGKVINISSFAALRRGANTVIYATAKTALTGFTRALALEWAPFNIQVNAVAPGSFPDPVTSGERYEPNRARIAGEVPAGRAGEVREVGELVAYLASARSDYLTGQTIHLDGGSTL
jgi:NAD(P)-dependent dehydrogenase (short-subunit alcohol dehydrogenase family)